MMEPNHKFYIQSLNRAFAILEAISHENTSGITLSAIAEATNLPVSTVYRILQNLTACHYAAENRDGKYVLGSEISRLGRIAQNSHNVLSKILPYLEELGKITGQTIFLTKLDLSTGDVYYAKKIPAPGAFQLSSKEGGRNFIHSTANGKVLVSRFSDEQISALIKRTGMAPLTRNTITNFEKYLQAVREVDKNGYALDDEENERGVFCIGNPIYNAEGEVIASFSVSGIKGLSTQADRERWIEEAKKMGRRINAITQKQK